MGRYYANLIHRLLVQSMMRRQKGRVCQCQRRNVIQNLPIHCHFLKLFCLFQWSLEITHTQTVKKTEKNPFLSLEVRN